MHRFRTSTECACVLGKLAPFILLLSACAAAPVFDTAGIDQTITPEQAQKNSSRDGARILWGGIILATENLNDSTRIEVMAYPLDSSQSPDIDEPLQGRFMLVEQGFLEPLTYAEGRRVTVTGTLQGHHSGKVGDSDYDYPLVRSEQLKLWPEDQPVRTFFHIGIGLQF
jgi:outer membrane lipoprotein